MQFKNKGFEFADVKKNIALLQTIKIKILFTIQIENDIFLI